RCEFECAKRIIHLYKKTKTVPFIEHNDTNRALMSYNMQHQVVPLSRSEKCIVETGLKCQVALDSGVHERQIIFTDIDNIILSGNRNTLGIPLVIPRRLLELQKGPIAINDGWRPDVDHG
ncbi:hypothetical protein Golax_007613, partial [Gossypium laxum]|nr:hypothetical protein [Gossypium laxum]